MAKEPTPCVCTGFSFKSSEGEVVSTACSAVTSSKFAPGHDAKLKSLLIRAGVEGAQVTVVNEDGSTSEVHPLEAADSFGFHSHVEKGIDNAAEKERKRIERAEKAEARRVEREASAEAKKAERAAAAEAKKAEKAAAAEAKKAAAEAAKANESAEDSGEGVEA